MACACVRWSVHSCWLFGFMLAGVLSYFVLVVGVYFCVTVFVLGCSAPPRVLIVLGVWVCRLGGHSNVVGGVVGLWCVLRGSCIQDLCCWWLCGPVGFYGDLMNSNTSWCWTPSFNLKVVFVMLADLDVLICICFCYFA